QALLVGELHLRAVLLRLGERLDEETLAADRRRQRDGRRRVAALGVRDEHRPRGRGARELALLLEGDEQAREADAAAHARELRVGVEAREVVVATAAAHAAEPRGRRQRRL